MSDISISVASATAACHHVTCLTYFDEEYINISGVFQTQHFTDLPISLQLKSSQLW